MTATYENIKVKEGDFPEGEHPLETPWTLWFDKKHHAKNSKETTPAPKNAENVEQTTNYLGGLSQLGTFNTVEGFYRHYAYLTKPSEFPRDHNILCFRKGFKPAWEEFPDGGCWIIRIKRKTGQNYVNRMWESLIIAVVGEMFGIPDVVGCVLSTRQKDDVLSIWNKSNANPQTRFKIGEKLKEILDLENQALIQYKEHASSMKDQSTFRNARNYVFTTEEQAAANEE